jgi:integrase
VIEKLTVFLGHKDLAKLTAHDVVRWKKHLLALKGEEKLEPKTVRDVYMASVKATCQYLVEDLRVKENAVVGVRVRGVKDSKDDDKKGFSDIDAIKILSATLLPFSGLISAEMAAARRWVPWICAYTGARVNEITCLLPSDFGRIDGFECIVLRAVTTKGNVSRTIPLHDHLVEQGLLDYVEERRKAGLPLFYDPARSRGGKDAHPHWQKVGQRIAEWVGKLSVNKEVAPNHGWRHRWKSISRDVDMHPEVANFLFGHGSGKVSEKYGPRWVKTARKAIELIPRYDLPVPEGGSARIPSRSKRRLTARAEHSRTHT